MATVNRVLPWRRNIAPPAEEVAPLLTEYRDHHPKASTEMPYVAARKPPAW